MKRILATLMTLCFMCISGVAFVGGASVNAEEAAGPIPNTSCPDTAFFDPDRYCDGDKIADDAIQKLIIDILNWALVGVGTVVVIFVVIGGIMYMTAAGSAERAKSGTKIIGNAILALVLYLLMISILNFIIPGGVFSGT